MEALATLALRESAPTVLVALVLKLQAAQWRLALLGLTEPVA